MNFPQFPSVAIAVLIGCLPPSAAQAPSQRAGTTYPFAGGMNPDGSLRPSPPLNRLFTEEYYTEYSLLDPATGEYRVTRRTEESPIGGELVPFFSGNEGADVEFYDPGSDAGPAGNPCGR